MTWTTILDLMLGMVPPDVAGIIDVFLMQAAEEIGLPGSTGQSPSHEIAELFAHAIEAAKGNAVARMALRCLKRVSVPRSLSLWNGDAGEPLSESDRELLGW